MSTLRPLPIPSSRWHGGRRYVAGALMVAATFAAGIFLIPGVGVLAPPALTAQNLHQDPDVARFFADTFPSGNPALMARTSERIPHLLDAARTRIARDFAERPPVHRLLLHTLAEVCLNLSYYEGTQRALADSAALATAHRMGDADADAQHALLRARLAVETGRASAALAELDSFLGNHVSTPISPEQMVYLRLQRLRALEDSGRGRQARPQAEALLADTEKHLGTQSLAAARVGVLTARLRSAASEHAAARTLVERSVYQLRRHFGETHPELAQALLAAGMVEYHDGQRVRALALGNAAAEILERMADRQTRRLHLIQRNLGILNAQAGNHAAAERYLREALATARAIHAPEHPDVAASIYNLAYFDWRVLHNPGEAMPLMREALALGEKSWGPMHPDTSALRVNLARVFNELQLFDATRELLTDRLPTMETPVCAVGTRIELARALAQSGDIPAARPLLAQARENMERVSKQSQKQLESDFRDVQSIVNATLSVNKLALEPRNASRKVVGDEGLALPGHAH
ncbi:tetratricopeptide repeat protein [Tahibacter amnicola]|uniref:Tetratricopeptide repeat protein n=1 Tax=Tahibacter amnicola TaxID=2976241 RepID=A0ABY6BJ75_9GAMM|nr:tetratricopeptide repeat protein [Tahibacter amnicola]UXI69812.1 tetratricopeptide repeat protein [Tahibacter amnicola]